MTRTTDDPLLAQLAQSALAAQGLYEGAIDGAWGPKSDQAFVVAGNYRRYADLAKMTLTLSADQQADLAKFLKVWKDPLAQSRYQSVGHAADVPPALVAALHWRESGGDFTTYLHNGDPMKDAAGNPIPTVHVPRGILFNAWTTAATDAINREPAARAGSGIENWTASLPAMCIFAEYFNGEGYRERGVPDPYVLAGTSGYDRGKFTADGEYDPTAVDDQIGVLALLRAIVTA
jgi:lysozyme family protein